MRRTVLIAGLLFAVAFASVASAATIRAGVAVSLKEAMEEVAKGYESKTGDRVEFAFGSSGQVMAQIKGGAPVDLFISAADKQVDELIAAGLADADTRRVVAGNTLVLIVPRDSKDAIDSFDALGKVAVKRLAIGEPKTVPAGQYAQQVLKKLRLTAALSGRVVYGANVRQALDYVIRGEVTAGVVYATDAKQAGADKVNVVAEAPKGSHDPIVYPAVVVKKSRQADAAKRFLDHLASDDARQVLKKHGFTEPRPTATQPAADKP